MKAYTALDEKHCYNLKVTLNKKTIFIMIMGILLTKVNIINNLTPFGFAYLSAYTIMKGLNLPIFISVVFSTLIFQGFNGAPYLLAYVLVGIAFSIFKGKEYSLIKAILITSIIFVGSKILLLLMTNRLFIYDVFLILFEGVIAFSMTYIFSFSPPIENIKNIDVNNEKRICFFIILGLSLAGVNNIEIFNISLKTVGCILAIVYLGYVKGVFYGGTIGIILGMIAYIAEPTMPFIIGIFGLAGFLSGMFRDLGKLGSILGFVLGSSIVNFYISGLGINLFSYKEIIMGVLLLLLIPKKLTAQAEKILTIDIENKKEYMEKRDEIVIRKINKMSEVLESLGKTFRHSAEKREYNSTIEVYSLVDGVANEVCKDCPRHENCWKENYYRTYSSFFKLVSLIEDKDYDEDIEKDQIIDFCIRKKEILEETNHSIEKLKLNEGWKMKLNENRKLLGEQLDGFSQGINEIIKDIYINIEFNEKLEEEIYKELKNIRVDIDSVVVIETNKEDYEIFIDLNTPYEYENKIKKVVSEILGFPVINGCKYEKHKKKTYRFKLIRDNRYSAITKVANMANSENKVSGDSFTFGEMENIHYKALADGMGIGRKAKEESGSTISLLEKLMEANVDKDMMLKTINSVLRSKSNEEIFTTLDVSFIDLYSGKLQIIKTGCPASFIKKKDRIEVINSKTLPIGILEDIDFNIYEDYIEDGDIVIMISDGITEANKDIEDYETWMKEVILGINSINPQVIANEILNKANNISKGPRDDMTVLVTKVWKNM